MTQTAASTSTARAHAGGPDEFDVLAQRVRDHFASLALTQKPHLFVTDASGLFEAYLDAMADDQRKIHTCNACRRFIEDFGGMVFIDETTGATIPAFWPEEGVPAMYERAVAAMRAIVARARVTGVFVSDLKRWGTPVTGAWTHFGLTPPKAFVYDQRGKEETAFEVGALKREHYRMINTALAEFKLETVNTAVGLIKGEKLDRGEKVIGPATWFQRLHQARDAAPNQRLRDNQTWLAVAAAPPGFCNLRGGVLGTLLEDIDAGKAFADLKRRFDAKMDAENYQRSKALPSAGNVAQAERAIAIMGVTASLRRRAARLDEAKAIWTPTPAQPKKNAGGVFGHLETKGQKPAAAPMRIPATNITWVKFASTVLPDALRIEFHTVNREDSYAGLITAVDADAPPILQWDHEGERNPVSWYLYVDGSHPTRWALPANAWVEVDAVVPKPSQWSETRPCDHQGKGVILVLRGARDIGEPKVCLFPEILKSQFHKYRSTIEAYNKTERLEGPEDGTANGIMISAGGKGSYLVRVTTATGIAEYRIDRWD